MKNGFPLCSFLFLCACFIIDSSASNPVDHNIKIREKRNIICFFGLTDAIKETLYTTLLDMRKLDPASLNDTSDGRLHDGVLRGLSTLTNLTDLNVFCNGDDLIIFRTTLRMQDAEVWYRWSRRVLFKLKGSVWMKAKEVDFDLEIRLNTTSGLHFEVTNSLITKVDNFEVGFKGLGMLNPVVRKVLYKKWEKKVADKIGLLIKKSLTKKLESLSDSLHWLTLFK